MILLVVMTPLVSSQHPPSLWPPKVLREQRTCIKEALSQGALAPSIALSS